jgi:hypothetical protein
MVFPVETKSMVLEQPASQCAELRACLLIKLVRNIGFSSGIKRARPCEQLNINQGKLRIDGVRRAKTVPC